MPPRRRRHARRPVRGARRRRASRNRQQPPAQPAARRHSGRRGDGDADGKSVEIGLGARRRSKPGSQAHDTFALDGDSVVRASNRAGGIEGGMSNGQPMIVRVAVKPIPTLAKALPSVNLHAAHRRAGDRRPQRRLRRSGGGDRRRSDGAPRADRSGAREVRRRFDGRDARQSASQLRRRGGAFGEASV